MVGAVAGAGGAPGGTLFVPSGSDTPLGRVEEWVAERLAQHREPSGVHVQRRADGRWVQINERKTTEGGTIANTSASLYFENSA